VCLNWPSDSLTSRSFPLQRRSDFSAIGICGRTASAGTNASATTSATPQWRIWGIQWSIISERPVHRSWISSNDPRLSVPIVGHLQVRGSLFSFTRCVFFRLYDKIRMWFHHLNDFMSIFGLWFQLKEIFLIKRRYFC